MLFGGLFYVDKDWLLFIALQELNVNVGLFSLVLNESVRIVGVCQPSVSMANAAVLIADWTITVT